MTRQSQLSRPRRASLLAATCAALVAALLGAGGATAAPPAHSGATAARAARAHAHAERVERYWTPARMRSARPLELRVGADGGRKLTLGAAEPAGATASFNPVPTPEVLPFAVNGRIFLRQGKERAFCSGTAINSPTRQLVLTAGHCVGSGPAEGHPNIRSSFLEFVPAYTGGVAPFGVFVAQPGKVFALKDWTKHGNPDFDMGVFLTNPNSEGVNVADAVGGGATIVTDLSRHQNFQAFGYPGETTRMQTCQSPYVGDDILTNPFPGPPTMAIRCHWAPGASGGAWLIENGTEVDGITTYLHLDDKSHTYSPFFSAETIGKLVAGL
jgi:V8-like Glu-specific endopeptidase